MASVLYLAAFLAAGLSGGASRAVNISNTWFLPQEGFPVFYRYFRDRITWFEADAVCQFHHANLVTVDSSKQYDTTRAYLKELDVVTNVWIGLKKKGPNDEFLWTDYRTLARDGGYWQEQIPKSEAALCAAIDPAADFRWHSLNCGGPETASFICELPVPPWARKADGCMLTALPSLTVTFLPEQAAVELTSDCGLDGTRRIACKGQADHDEMMRQLSCDNGSEEEKPASTSSTTQSGLSSSSVSGTESHQPPTRHRRDADDISPSLLGTLRSTSTLAEETITHNQGRTTVYNDMSTMAITNTPAPTMTTFVVTNGDVKLTTQEVIPPAASSTNNLFQTKANHVAEQISSTADSSTSSTTEAVETTTPNTEPKELMQKIIFGKPPDQQSTITEMEEPSVSDVRSSTSQSFVTAPNVKSGSAALDMVNEAKELTSVYEEERLTKNQSEDIKLEEKTLHIETTTMPPNSVTADATIVRSDNSTDLKTKESTRDEKAKNENRQAVGGDGDHRRQFLPASLRGLPHSVDNQTVDAETNTPTDWSHINDQQDDAQEFQMLENEPEIPARPNRGRRLTRPQSHSFYPYFLNRVLG